MANKNFIVHNGITAGPITIDATTGDITTTGNVSSNTFNVGSISKNDSSITINDSGAASSVNTVLDSTLRMSITGSALNISAGSAYRINNVDTLTTTTLGLNVVNSSLTSVGTLGSLAVTNGITASTIAGTLQTGSQPNITSVGTLTALTASGAIAGSTLAGTLQTAAQPNITLVGTLGSLAVTNSITGASLTTTGAISGSTLTGTLQTAAQPNITSVGSLTSLVVSGDLTVNGTSTSINTTNVTFNDGLIQLASGNSADTLDLGIVSQYNSAGAKYAVMARDATDKIWKLRSGITTAPGTTVNFTQGIYDSLNVNNLTAAGQVTGASGIFTNTTSLRLKNSTGASGYGVLHYNDNSNYYILLTNNNDANGSFNGLRPLRIDLATGDVYIASSLVLSLALTLPSITKTGGNGVGNIGQSANRFATVYAQATSALYADIAENYLTDTDYVPGTVVAFGGTAEVTQTLDPNDRRIAGVVSTNPAYLMNDLSVSAPLLPIALQGKVPCKVTGKITKGDMMVSSAIPGTARAWIDSATDPRMGSVIGKALEDKTTMGTGTIEVVVGRM